MSDFTQQLERWHDFHLLLGGAAATLMGLTFVAVTLAPEVVGGRVSTAVRAFVTPIVAFFGTALIVSLLLLIPRMTPRSSAVLLGLVGAIGAAYLVSTGAHRQWRESELGLDDWIWYIGLPLASYAALLGSAVGWWEASFWEPYAADGAILVLLIVGIRNAWDSVLAIARQRQERSTL